MWAAFGRATCNLIPTLKDGVLTLFPQERVFGPGYKEDHKSSRPRSHGACSTRLVPYIFYECKGFCIQPYICSSKSKPLLSERVPKLSCSIQ
jgi:hypothetical protein